MYTLHSEVMPTNLQAQLMVDFEDIVAESADVPSLQEAKDWFSRTITKTTCGPQILPVTHQARRGEIHNGRIQNSDIHIDNPGGRCRTKFVAVVANTTRNGTLFFGINAECRYRLRNTRAEEIFCRQGGKLALRAAFHDIPYEQGANGQICSFGTANQLHSAAPLYKGDQKILLFTY